MKHIISTALLISTCLAFPAFAGGGTVAQTPVPTNTPTAYDQCNSSCQTHSRQVSEQCMSNPGADDKACDELGKSEYATCTDTCDIIYNAPPLILPEEPKAPYGSPGPYRPYWIEEELDIDPTYFF